MTQSEIYCLWLVLIIALIALFIVSRRILYKSKAPSSAQERISSRDDNNISADFDPNSPQPFGYKLAWYIIPTNDVDVISKVFGLKNPKPLDWNTGIQKAYDKGVFISPGVKGWNFILGTSLGPSDNSNINLEIGSNLKRLSDHFGYACYFATHRVLELHIWARARYGEIDRAFGYVGEIGEIIWDQGEVTSEEVRLGFNFSSIQDLREIEKIQQNDLLIFPTEEDVMMIAGEWSLSPIDLSPGDAQNGIGVVGIVENS
jgi:hypothetical protein